MNAAFSGPFTNELSQWVFNLIFVSQVIYLSQFIKLREKSSQNAAQAHV